MATKALCGDESQSSSHSAQIHVPTFPLVVINVLMLRKAQVFVKITIIIQQDKKKTKTLLLCMQLPFSYIVHKILVEGFAGNDSGISLTVNSSLSL